MELRFPIQSGFNNYFSWVGLSLCQSLPVNITVGLFMFYRSIATLPRITSKLVWGMGWNYFFGEMLLGMVFTVRILLYYCSSIFSCLWFSLSLS